MLQADALQPLLRSSGGCFVTPATLVIRMLCRTIVKLLVVSVGCFTVVPAYCIVASVGDLGGVVLRIGLDVLGYSLGLCRISSLLLHVALLFVGHLFRWAFQFFLFF